jgi:hypothetical protein
MLGVAISILAVHEARADDVEAARRDFTEGVRLFQHGDYEGARRLFKKSDSEHHAAAIVYNLAFAEERLSHLQAALDAYEAYVAEIGDKGEYSSAAGVAIAQIKARSTRLRLDTKPAGARLFVDGSPLAEAAPTTFIVPAGHHVVVAQGDGWRGEEDIEVRGAGDVLSVVVKQAEGDAPVVTPVPPPATPVATGTPVEPDRAPQPVPPIAAEPAPDGFVWGAAFALAPYHLAGAAKGTSNESGISQVLAGAILEFGHALTDRFEFLGRGFVALGPDGKPSYAFMGGPGISLRLGSSLWLGATFVGGQIETRSKDVRYGTDLVFGAMAEATYAIIPTRFGQWTISIQPGLLLTDKTQDNTAFFFPITFGYRAY